MIFTIGECDLSFTVSMFARRKADQPNRKWVSNFAPRVALPACK